MEKKNDMFFVYGTLRKGHGNHTRLRLAEYVATTKVRGFKMRSIPSAGFPFVYWTGCMKDEVIIEVYKVDDHMNHEATLRSLDLLEGYPHMYKRMSIKDSEGNRGWIYFDDGHFGTEYGLPVDSGDWDEFKKDYIRQVRTDMSYQEGM